jgi:hypothetical protein
VLSNSDKALIESVKAVQGIQLYEEDLHEMSALKSALLLDPDRIVDIDGVEHAPFDPSVKNGKFFGSIAGGLIGLAVAAIPGVNIGVWTLIAIGSTVGGLIGGLLAPRPRKPAEERFAPSPGFNGGGTLAPLGGVVPLTFANRSINPYGGVRVSGYLVNSKVVTREGAQTLYQLYCLGLGPIGSINAESVLIDDQSLQNFLVDEITITTRLGTQDQTAIPEFTHYSQVVSPNTNSYFGVSKRETIRSGNEESGSLATFTNFVDTAASATTGIFIPVNELTKDSGLGITDGWNAGAFGDQAITEGTGWAFFQPLASNKEVAFGISQTNTDADFITIEYCIVLKNDATYRAYYNGTLVYDSTGVDTYTTLAPTPDYFVIAIAGGSVVVQKNSDIFWQFTQPPTAGDYFIDVSIYDAGASIKNIKIGNTFNRGAVAVGSRTTLKVSEENFESFIPTERYRIGETDFRVTSKDRDTYTVTITPALPFFYAGVPFDFYALQKGTTIHAVYKSTYETSKSITFLDFNFGCSLYKRSTKDNRLWSIGVCFDLYIKPLGSPDFLKIGRFLLTGRNPNGSRRSLRIKNLPYLKYYFEFRPITEVESSYTDPIYWIDDSNKVGTANTISINSNVVQIEVESDGATPGAVRLVSPATTNDYINVSEDKFQYSTESGPPVRISTVNECLYPADIGLPADIMNYKGFAMIGYGMLASDRLLNAPQTSVIIEEGIIAPNLMAAGETSNASTLTALNDPSANFIGDGVLIGWIVRNLTRHIEAPITGVTAGTISTTTALNWRQGDRYLVYFNDSTPYYADQYVYAISNKAAGLGNYIDGDYFNDYPSICETRKHEVLNKLFHETSLSRSVNFSDWANETALKSLCLPGRIDGRFGLTPEIESSIKGVYNAARVRAVQYDYAAWSEQAVNKISATWYDGSDGKFTPKSCIVETTEAYNGTEPIVEETLDLTGVNNPDQAKRIVQVYIKTRRLQDKQVSFETDLQEISTMPGDLFVFNHPTVEYNFEVSGWVHETKPFNAGTQTIAISQKLNINTPTGYRAVVKFREVDEVQLDIPMTINANQTLTLSGLNYEVQIGDVVVIGAEIVTRNVFRATSIKPQISKNTISISGVLRPASILDTTGLITTCDPVSATPPVSDFGAS